MAKRSSTAEFIEKARQKHGDKYDYSRVVYTSSHAMIDIGCPVHGWFEQRAYSHLNYGCKRCGNDTVGAKRRTNVADFIARANAIHGGRYSYEQVAFERQHDLITIVCPSHGEFRQAANDHLKGHGCRRCFADANGARRKGVLRLSSVDFAERANRIHDHRYEYNKAVYRGLRERVTITCRRHGDFEQRAVDHLSGSGCQRCSHNAAMSFEDFEERARNVHGDRYDYQHYSKLTEKLTVICPDHGPFRQTGTDHIYSSAGCPTCAIENVRSKLRYTKAEFESKLMERWEDRILLVGRYVDLSTSTSFECVAHGMFENKPEILLQTKHGCPHCWEAVRGMSLRLTQEEFEVKARLAHGNKYQYGRFTTTDTKIVITCPKHGVFTQNAGNHLSGMGCPCCGLHKVESQNSWLDAMGLPPDQREVWLTVGDKRIKADGYDPSTRTVYEFWGDFWHGNPKLYNKEDINPATNTTFGELYERTLNKRRLITDHGYSLVEIWEDDWRRIRDDRQGGVYA